MSEAVLLTLTKARTELGSFALEQHVANALSFPPSQVTVVIDDDDDDDDDDDCTTTTTTIIAHQHPENNDHASSLEADALAAKINSAIQSGAAEGWTTGRDATCEVADDEESVYVEEEEALEMWREMSEDARTGHLEKVPNPDGVMIQPTHEGNEKNYSNHQHPTCTGGANYAPSPVDLHLRRDPTLLDYDNVRRIDISDIHTVSWKEPIIITNANLDETLGNRILGKQRLASYYGEVEVRTGNRETLIENGITNSKPMPLSEALLAPRGRMNGGSGNNTEECGRIVFSPIRELTNNEFANELNQFTDCFPSYYHYCTKSSSTSITPAMMKTFTLTLASEGFGIGMHKHKAAMFMLLVGRKKWYMSSSEDLDGDDSQTTHPGFYAKKSSHKCIQKVGEVLFVPDGWYHEIFNLEYTAGIQALPE